jgi:hypothetical protein
LTQIRHFLTQLRQEVLEVSLAAIAGRNKKYAVHDVMLVAKLRSGGPDEFLVTTGSAKVYSAIRNFVIVFTCTFGHYLVATPFQVVCYDTDL